MSIRKLREEPTKNAIRRVSWDDLKAHLDSIQLDSEGVEKLLGLMLRGDALILKRGDRSLEDRREELFSKLAEHLLALGFEVEHDRTRALLQRFKKIESCYQGIVAWMQKSDAAKFTAERRIGALLSRSNHEHAAMAKQLHDKASSGELQIGDTKLKDESGRKYNVHAVHEALINALGSSLMMTAYEEGWFDKEGTVVVPSIPEASDDDRYAVGSIQMPAVFWDLWSKAERSHRYLGEPLVFFDSALPDWAASNARITEAVEAKVVSDASLLDLVANARLETRMQELYFNLLTDPVMRDAPVDIQGHAELLPSQFVSIDEVQGAISLSQLLSSEIAKDAQEHCGLRLVEWLRGYAVLQRLASEARREDDPESLTLRMKNEELVAALQRLGVQGGKASAFIKLVSFKLGSRDLFDHPIIQLADGTLLVIGAAIEHASLARVLLSTLGALRVNLDERGKHFETYVINRLQKLGFEAKNIQVKRDGEQYDYDVVFVWEDYLFVLECKSHGLSGNDPTAAYYFGLGVNSVAKQVKRLVEALRKHPDILSNEMPQAVGKTIIPCVLNALPYSIPGGINGIKFSDEASFFRFFNQPEIAFRTVDTKTGEEVVEERQALAHLWTGARPTAEDLVRHLDNPVEVILQIGHLTQTPTWMALGEGRVGMMLGYSRADLSPASIRKVLTDNGLRCS